MARPLQRIITQPDKFIPSQEGQSLCYNHLVARVYIYIPTHFCSANSPISTDIFSPHPFPPSITKHTQHIMVDLGTGNNNKINWALTDKQEFIDIVETVFRGARKGRGLVVSPKDYSTKYRY
jgi:DIM1 family U5 snRNP protein